MKVKIVRSIKDVDPRQWNNITRGPFFSHEWFSSVEKIEGHRHAFYYFLVTEAERLIGALPAFVPLHPADIYRNYLYGKFRRWIDAIPGPATRPPICHCLCCSGKNLFSDQEFLPKILPEVTERVQEVAVQEGFSEFVFIFVREHEEALRSALTESGFRSVLLSSAAILENRFPSFDDYLHSLSRNGRNSVKGDLRRFEEAGCVLAICEHPEEEVDVIYHLLKNIEKKYPSTLTKLSPGGLKAVFQNMSPYRETYFVREGGANIGTVTLFQKDDVLAIYAMGLEYSRVKETSVYFNLCYYLPIREMIRQKAPYLNFNHMAYRVKETRGATLVPQYMFIKSLRRASMKRFWFGVVDRRYRYKFGKEYARDKGKNVREATGGPK